MKLNLLPTYVSKEGQIRNAVIGSAIVLLACIGAAVFLVKKSTDDLSDQKARVEEFKPKAEAALRKAQEADVIIQQAEGIDRNLKLAEAMAAHNSVYPALYRDVLSYIPSYFRVNSINASPTDENSCTVTITGVIQSYQQYADLMLALLRTPGCTQVARAGYQLDRKSVPELNETDQIGIPIRASEARLPSDGFERFQAYLSRATDDGGAFLNANGFGSESQVKGAMPGWSQITVAMVLNNVPGGPGQPAKSRNLLTPDPTATINKAVPGPTTPAPGTQGPGGGQVPGGNRPGGGGGPSLNPDN